MRSGINAKTIIMLALPIRTTMGPLEKQILLDEGGATLVRGQ